jgi:uncharacterized Tic20 family protein
MPPLPGTPPSTGSFNKDERLWASIAHLSGILFAFVAPLVIWFIKREESKFVDDQAKEATNFQISVAIVMIAGLVLSIIPIVGCVTFMIPLVAWVASVVFAIIAAVKSNEGATYRYPFTFRLIK